jgi:hypothetical protein
LATAISDDLGQAEAFEDFPHGVELAAAAVDDDEIGPLRKRIIVGPRFGGVALRRLQSRLKRRSSTSRIIA